MDGAKFGESWSKSKSEEVSQETPWAVARKLLSGVPNLNYRCSTPLNLLSDETPWIAKGASFLVYSTRSASVSPWCSHQPCTLMALSKKHHKSSQRDSTSIHDSNHQMSQPETLSLNSIWFQHAYLANVSNPHTFCPVCRALFSETLAIFGLPLTLLSKAVAIEPCQNAMGEVVLTSIRVRRRPIPQILTLHNPILVIQRYQLKPSPQGETSASTVLLSGTPVQIA